MESNERRGSIPEMVKILEAKKENRYTTTLVLDKKMDATPGQFVMVWLPGVDEKPMSVRRSGRHLHITVEGKGKCTELMAGLSEGGTIGIRGPFGKGFSQKKDCIIIGGGAGMPPLMNLYEQIGDSSVRLLQGARSKERLIFTGMKGMKVATDDGSQGHRGFVTELLEEEIKSGKPKIVYTCGPEPMMVRVREICKKHGIMMEASLERYMRCGIGICGSCACGRSVVCKDGPVFTIGELEKNPDFGRHALSMSARKQTLEEYYGGKK